LSQGSPGSTATPQVLRLAAGLVLLDVLLNLPALVPSRALASLLSPSVDLLVAVALAMSVARAGEHARGPLRVGFALIVAALAASAAGLRFGWDAGARLLGSSPAARIAGWGVSLLIVLAGAGITFVLFGLLQQGMQRPIIRGVVVVVVGLAAVLQVVSGRRLFLPSVIPRLVRLLW
jgi:hypothetical protein